MEMLWRFSDGGTWFAREGGRVVIDVRSVTCNECLSPRDHSLVPSMLAPRECPGGPRRMILKRRAKRPSRDECFCLFSEGTIDALEMVCGIEDVEEDFNML